MVNRTNKYDNEVMTMSRSTLTATVSAAALAVFMGLVPPAAADVIGEVDLVRVWAYGTAPGGEREDLRRNMSVETDEVVETVKTGELRIVFADGTTLGLGSESTVMLDELVYSGGQNDSLTLELTNSFFNFVTGDIAKEAVTINTPAMVIGVRGTDLAISIDAEGNTEVGVREGEAEATPTAGGETVSVPEGSTATASPGDRSIGVAGGLSGAALGDMPGAGGTPGGGVEGAASSGGGNGGSEIEREPSEHSSEPSSPSSSSSQN